MEDNSKRILSYPLRLLKWIALNPDQSRTKYFVIGGIYSFFGTTSLILSILQFIYANGNIIAIARNVEAVVAFGQFIGKVLITAVKLKDFHKLINDTTKFWPIEECAEEIRIRIQTSFTRTLYIQKLFSVTTASLIIIMIAPTFTKQILPTGMWVMTNHTRLFTYAFISQEIIVSPIAMYYVGYDNLFLGFCAQLTAQFLILNYLLKDLKTSTICSSTDKIIYLNKLKSYVVYHNFLLRFSRVLRDAYSPVMLVEYSSILVVLCVEMFAVFESENTFQFLRFFVPMFGVLVQLSFYCIPLNYVTDQALSISQGIYESDWYSKRVSSLNTVVPIIIQRSQEEIIFKAGGLVEMNCRTLLNVIKTSYSVCAIMRAIKNV